GQPNQDDRDKRIEDIKRTLYQGANEAQTRIKRVAEKATEYWQQAQTAPTPRQASTEEEQRIRQLANSWSSENWRVARELGTYMDIISSGADEVWEVTLRTRWETRTMEVVTEPYTGRQLGKAQPLMPVWDYELPSVTGLKAPASRTRLDGLDEVVACTNCNGTGRALCATCAGRGWYVCPECRGRIKKRCSTCRGRGYVADWVETKKKPFFKKQAENLASSVNEKVADVFDGIRQQGVPIPNPVDTDPANKGKTVPCPDCINGEVDCSCGNGKRICETCQGAKSTFCATCSGTGKVVRHREIARHFDLNTRTRFVGSSPIPERYLATAGGEVVYNTEVNETLHPEAAPEGVPMDVWHATVEMAQEESANQEKRGTETPLGGTRASLQVLELVRIPYTRVDYRYGNQNYTFFVYDGNGQEKFYADRYPARWDRIERLVRAISVDLMTPTQQDNMPQNQHASGYRVHIEVPPYTVTEDEEENI
ncbi:MAG TPA: hypothetical protein DEV72_09560, partial [Ktedonobacter sp.]|nr:hypothetical protein [Ktedonobacter sp.]